MRHIPLVVGSLLLFLAGCDHGGLDPTSVQEPGFSGQIRFQGRRPAADSLKDLRLVAVPYYPIDTTFQLVILKVLDGTIAFGTELTPSVSSDSPVRYELRVKPNVYPYVAIVQQYGADVFSQWRVVSVYGYSALHPSPSPVTVRDGELTTSIDLTVDFDHLPPQPFRTP